MQHNLVQPAEATRQPGVDELADLNKRRGDILAKMAAMIKHNTPLEISNTACHVCGRRFSLRFEMEARGRSKNVRFSIGPEGPQCPAGTYYVGNCAASRDADQSGYHCNGCPPQERQIWDALGKVR